MKPGAEAGGEPGDHKNKDVPKDHDGRVAGV